MRQVVRDSAKQKHSGVLYHSSEVNIVNFAPLNISDNYSNSLVYFSA